MTPFLSIIIPIYKIKESYLRECFDSLLAQDMKDFQMMNMRRKMSVLSLFIRKMQACQSQEMLE